MILPHPLFMKILGKIDALLTRGDRTITITKRFKLDIGHRIWNQKLPKPNMKCKCVQFHGHTCYVEVTISGPFNIKSGMVLDFNIIKPIIKELTEQFDHKMLVHELDPLAEDLKEKPGVIITPFLPTAENLALFVMEFFNEKLPTKYKCSKVRWYETADAWADVTFK